MTSTNQIRLKWPGYHLRAKLDRTNTTL